MASPTVQMNVRVSPDLADAMKARADKDGISLSACVIEAFTNHTKSNGSAGVSPEKPDRAATKGA